VCVSVARLQPLVNLLDSRNVQTFQHATGVLYAIALDAENFEALVAAKAPPYLTRPLHQRCACEPCEPQHLNHLTTLRSPRLLVLARVRSLPC
jgi:hypothetical protein